MPPGRSVDSAPVRFPIAAASTEIFPASHALRNPALKLSPAPIVSTGCTASGRTHCRSLPVLHQSPSLSTFDYDHGYTWCEFAERFFERCCIRNLQEFLFVWEEYVYLVEQLVKDPAPGSGRVVIGIQRQGQPSRFQIIEELRQPCMQAGLKKQGR